ncbi:MAG: protein phosphatase 2C domain-containing protein [Bacteroidia bacterium]|nr:protein phosphatase 2C domain-containing protein [Bacteroidia bacterium]
MKIQIKQPAALHESGGKELNEDFIYPLAGKAGSEGTDSVFIVCDGEGGPNAGEVASKLVALSFAKYITSTSPEGEMTAQYLEKALRTAEEAISAYKEAHPESAVMSTTLALMFLGETQVSFSWIGNSRIYHFDSLKGGLNLLNPPSEEDSVRISGNHQPVKLNFKTIPYSDIHKDDCFFLATDGITDHADSSVLETVLKGKNKTEPAQLVEDIHKFSHGFAKDNYSCYLIQVDQVENTAGSTSSPTSSTRETGKPAGEKEPTVLTVDETEERNAKILKNLAFAALIVVVLCLVFLAWRASLGDGNKFEELVNRGDKSMENSNFQLAIAQYDSALQAAKTDTDKEIAGRLKAKALTNLGFAGLNLEAEPLDSLKLTAEAYKEAGDEFFRLGNYEEALRSYNRSERVKSNTEARLPEIPRDNVALAYIHLADKVFEQPERDCQQVVALYSQAFKVYESPEITSSDPEMVKRAQERTQECKALLAGETTENNTLKPAITEITPPKKENPETLAVKTETPAETPETKTRSLGNLPETSPKTTTSPVPTTTTTPTTTTAAPETRRTAINTRSISKEEQEELEKFLATGKRLFVKARDTQSAYEYRLSAENLENAAQILDGPSAYMLAYVYNSGLGMDKDEAKALKYAQVSALHEWPAGHYLYAHLLLERRFARDTVTARQSLIKAANQNFLKAIERLEELGGK